MGGVRCQHDHIGPGMHGGIGADPRRGRIGDLQHIDDRAHPHRAARRSPDANQQHRLAGCGDHRHIARRPHHRPAADAGRRRLGDQIDPDRRRRSYRAANPDTDANRHVIEIIPRAHQDRLARIGPGRAGIHLGVRADIGPGIGVDHLNAGRHADTEVARPEGHREGADLVLVARGHRHAVEPALRYVIGGRNTLQCGIVDRIAAAIAGQIHPREVRRADLPRRAERRPIARGGPAQRG